eukprot:2071898-Prymnesium_polylepis.1
MPRANTAYRCHVPVTRAGAMYYDASAARHASRARVPVGRPIRQRRAAVGATACDAAATRLRRVRGRGATWAYVGGRRRRRVWQPERGDFRRGRRPLDDRGAPATVDLVSRLDAYYGAVMSGGAARAKWWRATDGRGYGGAVGAEVECPARRAGCPPTTSRPTCVAWFTTPSLRCL